jgi:hypothetical protein
MGRRRVERRTKCLKDSGGGVQCVLALRSVRFFEEVDIKMPILSALSTHRQRLRPTFVLLKEYGEAHFLEETLCHRQPTSGL